MVLGLPQLICNHFPTLGDQADSDAIIGVDDKSISERKADIRKLTLDDILGDSEESGDGEQGAGDDEEEGGQGGGEPDLGEDAHNRKHWNLATYLPPAAEEYFYFIIGTESN